MPKFAASLNLMFTEWPLLDRFAAARDAGFKAVEVQFPYAETPDAIARHLTAAGLELVLINTPRGSAEAGGRGLAALPEHAEEFRRAFAQALDYMKATGCRMVHVMAGTSPTANEATFEASLRHAAECLAPIRGSALLEPLNRFDNPGYFLGDFDLAARIIRHLALPNVRLQYDFYHRQRLHGEIVSSLTEMLPIVGHVQFAGVPGRHEPDDGEIDYGHLFATLDRLGYTGWVGAEYTPRAGTLQGLGWLERWGECSHAITANPPSHREFATRQGCRVMPKACCRTTPAWGMAPPNPLPFTTKRRVVWRVSRQRGLGLAPVAKRIATGSF